MRGGEGSMVEGTHYRQKWWRLPKTGPIAALIAPQMLDRYPSMAGSIVASMTGDVDAASEPDAALGRLGRLAQIRLRGSGLAREEASARSVLSTPSLAVFPSRRRRFPTITLMVDRGGNLEVDKLFLDGSPGPHHHGHLLAWAPVGVRATAGLPVDLYWRSALIEGRFDDLAQEVLAFHRLLQARYGRSDGLLDGGAIDVLARNVIESAGTLSPIDLEFEWDMPIPAALPVFRSLEDLALKGGTALPGGWGSEVLSVMGFEVDVPMLLRAEGDFLGSALRSPWGSVARAPLRLEVRRLRLKRRGFS